MFAVRAQVPIFTEGFEGGSMPAGWTTIDANADGYDWTYFNSSTRSAHTGTGIVYSASYVSSAISPDNWLITPAINLTSSSTLKYWVCAQDASYAAEHYGVYISTTSATDTSSFTLLFEETLTSAEATWTERTINLQNYTGTIYIAFRHFNCYDQFEMKLDDISVLAETTDPMIVSNIFSLDFGQVFVNDTSEVKQVTVEGYNLTSAITATVTAPFEISTDNINFSYSETLANTGGTLYVRYLPTALGNDNATLTLSSGSATGNVSLSGIGFNCESTALPLVESFENIATLTCWTALSANTTNQIGLVSTYSSDGLYSLRFSSMNQAANYNQYLITPELPTDVGKFLSFDYRTYYSTEIIRIGYSTTTNEIDSFVWGDDIYCTNYYNWETYSDYTIPVEAKYIAINYKSTYSSHLFIDNLIISERPSCMYPLNVTTNNISGHTIGVSWTTINDVETTETFYVEYKNAADETAEWQQVYTTENNIILTNLEPMTMYDIRVYIDCSESTSDTVTLTASTIEACRMPLNITVSQITGTSALVSWTPDPTYNGTQEFILEYTTEDGTAQTITVSGVQHLLSGLDQNTEYDVLLYMDCAEDGLSDTLSTSFSTRCFVGGDVAIGSGTETSGILPSYSNYNYTYSQQIFLASEMGGASNINSISLESGSLSIDRDIKIYLMHTSATNSSSWLPATTAQEVYNDTLILASGWSTYNFTTPFAYNGTDNLALIIIDATGTYTYGNTWMTHESFANCSQVSYSDYTEYTITSTPELGYTYSVRNNVIFGMDCDSTATCIAPNLVVDNIGANEVTVVWASGAAETSWEVEYKESSETEWTSEGTVTVLTHTFSNLQPNTEYDIRVGVDCGTEILWRSVTVRTGCTTYSVPFSENFDAASSGTIPFCWETEDNQTYIDSYVSLSGSNSLYMGTGYDYGSLIVLPEFDESVVMDSLIVTFNVFADYYSGNVKIGIMTNPSDPSTFVQVGTYSITEANQWESVELNTRNYTGQGRHLALQILSGSYLYIYVDNITVNHIPACLHVENIQATNITTNSATITWDAVGSEYTWEYLYGTNVNIEEDQPIQVYDTEVILTDLTSNTAYDVYVRAVCSDSENSTWEHYSFRTDCEALASIPFEEDFESYEGGYSSGPNILPYCWSRINTGESSAGCPTVYSTSTYSSSGMKALYFYSSPATSYADQYAILPEINTETLNISALRLSFNAARPNSSWYSYADFLIVGVMTDNTDASTFVVVDTVTQLTNTPTRFFVDFTDYTGTGSYIAIKAPVPSGGFEYSTIYVDDVVLDVTPSCGNPENLTATVISSSEAQITWESEETETAWQMLVVPANAVVDFTQAEAVNTNSHTLSDLSANTAYSVYVRTVCSNGEGYSEWVSTTFMTISANPVEAPFAYGFEDAEINAAWGLVNNATGNQWYIGMPTGATDTILYISNDGGVTAGYNVNSPCHVWAYLDILMPEAAEFDVKFKWSGVGEPDYDYMRAFLGNPNAVTASTSSIVTSPIGTEQFGGENYNFCESNSSSWFSQTFNSSMGGGVKRLYFVWRNDGSYGILPAIQIDSIVVSAYNCGRPYGLEADNILPYTAEVSFTPALSTDAAWQYVVTEGMNPDDPTLTPMSIGSTLIQLSGLTPETMYYVYVRTDCGDGQSAWSDPVSFMTPVACPAPSNITAINITQTSATINWTENGTATEWTLEYGVAGFAQGTGTLLTVTGTPSQSLTGLTTATMYDVYVTTNCSATEESISVLCTFSTSCEPLQVPYSENFDSYTGTTYDTLGVVPSCWNNYTNNTVYPAPHITGSGNYNYPNSGTNALTFTAGSAGADAMAILPEFSTPLNQLDLSFYYRVESVSYGTLTVGYVTDVADPVTSFTLVATMNNTTTLTEEEVSFTDLTDVPAGARIAFKWTHNDSYYSCGIDDINVTGSGVIPADTCNVPTALAVSNVSQTGATATWTAGGEESAWNLQYKEASASDWGNSINVTSTNYAITGLTASTAYQVRVQAVCGTSETSDWTEAVSFTTLDEAAEFCPAPTELEATDVQNETITLTWEQEANTANSWEVQYRVQGSETWNSATATAVPYTLTGLTGLTTYEIQVVANCTNGLTSDPSNMITETTTNTGINGYDLESSVNLYPNPTASNVTISAQGMMESVSMYDVYGKLISTIKVEGTTTTVDLSSYASGVYFARITTENGVVTKRIVKK